ncbi:MAG TPA: hypothetical protein VEV42_17645 [Pyrinomonadaceae bacterium]|nr:hypothetical protein [Pyrinomonadaceae bacterium]
MSFSARHLIATILVFSGLSISLFGQSTPKQTKTQRGSVSGRITIKDKGAAGVVVGMRRSEGATPFEPFLKATTDQDGFYRISNVVPGSYEVIPSAPAFVTPTGNKSKTVVVGEGENVEDINFALVRGGVITGRVTDADGRPIIAQQVYLFRVETLEQQLAQRLVTPAGSGLTDDRGIYRIFAISAGRYKVAAGKADNLFASSFTPSRTVYKQVFHPDVTDQTKATIIEVNEGTEANNVDITLSRPLQTFSVSGRAVDAESGLPIPNLRVGLQRIAGPIIDFVNSPTSTNIQGDFTAEGLIPGKYGIYVLPNQDTELRAETLTFDVVDQDVSGLTVRLTKGASLTGVVVLESEDKTVFAKLSQMQVRGFMTMLAPGVGPGLGNSSSSPVAPDGSFRLAGLPAGTISLQLGSVMGRMLENRFSVMRVERDGVPVQSGVEIKDGEQVTGVRIIVSYGNATLRGVVKLENGSLPEGARIFLRLTRPGDNFANLRTLQVDSRGQFLMQGLPPGVYELTAMIANLGTAFPRSTKKEVTIQDGVVTR